MLNMSGLELLLEHLSEQKKAYSMIDLSTMDSDDKELRKVIIAESIIHTQSRIIEELIRNLEVATL